MRLRRRCRSPREALPPQQPHDDSPPKRYQTTLLDKALLWTVSYVGSARWARYGGAWSWIVPDELWEIAEPLTPPSKVRPQDTPDETLFAAIIYVLVSVCAWRALPPCFGISKSTAHRRFLIWSRAGVWGRLHEEILHRLDDAGLLDLSRAVLDSAHVRAKKGANSAYPGDTRCVTSPSLASRLPS